jgi:hypothetical protein
VASSFVDTYAGFRVHRNKHRIASLYPIAGTGADTFYKRIARQLGITAGSLADDARLAATLIDRVSIV